ncbi:hypothetical protein B0H12DRAFT_1243168 [Mycena haematopus]|nr:hypothetical protein B0H12DRAFT_1243168 [Mycena haematopus]
MPNSRQFVPYHTPKTFKTVDRFLRSRLYPTWSSSPSTVTVHTRCRSVDPQDTRFACVESVLDGAGVQPHVHDVCIILKHGRRTTHFRAFFKRHVHLPHNTYLNIKGDLLIMRVASANQNSVVNMRPGDQRLADFVARKMSEKIVEFQTPQRTRLPVQLKLVRRK